MRNPYDAMAITVGKSCVMKPNYTDEERDAENKRQSSAADAAIYPLIRGNEILGLDYGCGYGRLTPMLHEVMRCPVIGYDPSPNMIAASTPKTGIIYTSELPSMQAYDVIMAWAVLGSPAIDREATARHISSLLIPGGLLIIGDHIGYRTKGWWEFRSLGHYQHIFDRYDIDLLHLKEIGQCGEPFSLLCGRKAR